MRIGEFFEELEKKRCIDEVIKAHPEVDEATISRFFKQVYFMLKNGKQEYGDYEVYIDGASSSNPGKAGVGIVIKKGEEILKKISKPIGVATNNIAEYTALIEGLKTLKDLGVSSAKVFSDSELVVKQVNGEYAVKNPKLKELYKEVLKLLGEFDSIELVHIDREKNRDADKLAKMAVDT